MRATTVLVSSIVALALLAVGCAGGQTGGSQGGGGGGGGETEVRPALNLDVKCLGDQGFNDSAYAGLQGPRRSLTSIPSTSSPAPRPTTWTTSQLADSGYTPVYAVGFLMTDAVNEVSKQCPTPTSPSWTLSHTGPTWRAWSSESRRGSYLAGIVAGMMTQQKTEYTNPDDKVVGFLAGRSPT